MRKLSYENFFIHFSNKTKLAIISSLTEKPLSVNEIVKRTKEEQSNVSHNLTSLTKCRILNVKKEGKNHIYSLNKKTVEPMLKLVRRHINNCSDCCADCGKCFEK